MKKQLLGAAFAATLLTSASPALAAVVAIDLSATDVNAASVTHTFQAGTYVVSIVQAVYTAFAPATPAAGNWTDYYQYSTDGSTFTFYNTLNSVRYDTAAHAFAAYSAQPNLVLTLAQATAVTFRIGDSLSSLGDNTGGTSLSVASVPEPATWALMLVGLGAVGYGLRRRTVTKLSFA